MREYAKVSPKFWTSGTGKAIRQRGSEGVVVALYLMTSPHSNMLGLYFQPTMYMAYETGLGIEGASKGLRVCIEEGFCLYDEPSEMVWVFEMAEYQIAEELKASDLRCKGIQKEYDSLPDCPFLLPFFDRYGQAYHLSKCRGLDHPSQDPSKALRSQEQEQEQEHEQDKSTNPSGLVVASLPADTQPDLLAAVAEGQTQPEPPEAELPAGIVVPPCPHQEIIALYAAALPTLPQPRVWEGTRETNLRCRWRWVMTEKRKAGERAGTRIAETREQALDWFRKYFAFVAESDFLTGRNGQWTSCDLEWLTKANNFAKVLEGKYANKQEQAA
jgi:hypothetical protein